MSEENKEQQTETDADKKAKKPRFDAEQVAAINALRDEAITKERERVAQEWEAKMAAAKAEHEAKLAEAMKAIQPPKKEEPKKDEPPKVQTPDPAVEALKAQFAELKTMFDTVKTEKDSLHKQVEQEKSERRKSRKKDQFLNALTEAKVSFYDPLEAYNLAETEGLDYDDTNDKVIIKGKAGAPRLNENGEEMTILDYVKEFATRKNYLVKAATQDGGFGAGEQRKVEKPREGKSWAEMTPEEFEAEVQKTINKAR